MMESHAPVSPASHVVYRRRSFLSSLALALGAFLVTLTLSSAAVVLYGMNIADRKCDGVFGLLRGAVEGLPELLEGLPPALADVLSDRRSPEYLDRIEVAATLARSSRDGEVRPVVEIRNRGGGVVSFLSIHVVVLEGDGSPAAEWTAWGATPVAIEDEWRGLLLPGSTRSIPLRPRRLPPPSAGERRVTAEVTDIRLWAPPDAPREREV